MTQTAVKNTVAPLVAVGTILVARWGYEQTNHNFYYVAKATAKTVTLEPLKASRIYQTDHSYTCEPLKDDQGNLVAVGVPVRRAVKQDRISKEIHVQMESYEIARIWDGQPKKGTDYA